MTTWLSRKWKSVDLDTRVEVLLGGTMLTIGVQLGRGMESGNWGGFLEAMGGACLGIGLSKWRLSARKLRGRKPEAPS